ncbi:MAG: replication-associated recombination protein A [Bacteroidales bacterium]|jgi:putative ATPase|nr:replication-associated recombination protein A [Bacteroidales bacterium]NLH24016.1 replication-associated recombination protein A [Bacteroidales bacterium]HPJ82334.1 replication-associated recombination protein A [Bacteroidales bacterium]
MLNSNIPLAERMRPSSFSQFVGQEHLVSSEAVLRKMIESGNLASFILWGPPGVGKTTLARIIARDLERTFYSLSAVSSGVKDVREVIERSRSGKMFQKNRPILFIDEIHRFSKSQQDALLGAVEDGTIVLIGATTENPSFEVIAPLLSRCQVFVLKTLSVNDLNTLLERALKEDEYLRSLDIRVEETEALFRLSGGDARKLLNIIEIVISSYDQGETIVFNNDQVQKRLQKNIVLYDKNGEQHYDIISAFIKSIRGSDPNGAVYWMARMIAAGEDPLFIARRMVILASEDIGLANPNAFLMANACFDVVHKIGMPEGRIPLSQTAIYLATSAKSNSAYKAIEDALEAVRKHGDLSVPLHLRNAPTELMKELGYAKDYKYAHDYEHNFVAQEFLPQEISGSCFYNPQDNPREKEISRFLERWGSKYSEV